MSFISVTPDGRTNASKLIYYISETHFESSLLSLPHLHHFTEILFVSEGFGRLFINEGFCSIKKGDLIILDNGIMHAEVDNVKNSNGTPNNAETFSYYSIGLKKIGFKNLDQQNFIFNNLNYYKPLNSCFSTLFTELCNKEKNYDEIVCNSLQNLSILIERITHLTGKETQNTHFGPLKNVLQYIDANYNHDITLDSLAKMAFLSKSHLIRLFKSTTNQTPMEYLDSRRISAARTLLQTTNSTVTEISIILNYPSVSTFIERFKSYNNMTPLQYRKIAKANYDN